MNPTDIVFIVIAATLVGAFAVTAVRIVTDRRRLHERFGDEYERVVAERGGRAEAEAELNRRVRQHRNLEIRPLTAADQARYRAAWLTISKRFIDDPSEAVRTADQLVSVLVAERGYPVVDYRDRVSNLSVEHAGVLDAYRSAHAVAVANNAGRATTEELRQALVHYRTVASDLIGAPLGPAATNGDDSDHDQAGSGGFTTAAGMAPPNIFERRISTGPVRRRMSGNVRMTAEA